MQQPSSTAVNVAPTKAVVDPLSCPVIEWEGVRVVTTETLAKGYAVKIVTFVPTSLRTGKGSLRVCISIPCPVRL